MRKLMDTIQLNEVEQLDELKPLGALSKAKDTVLAKMGRKKSQKMMAAKDGADVIFAKWEKARKVGELEPTIATLSKWLSKTQKTDPEVLQAGFKGIGVDDLPDIGKDPKDGGESRGEGEITADSIPAEVVDVLQGDKYDQDNKTIQGELFAANIELGSKEPIGNDKLAALGAELKSNDVTAKSSGDPTLDEWEDFWLENNEGNTKAPHIKTLLAFINKKAPDIENSTVADELVTAGAKKTGLKPNNPVNVKIARQAIANILNTSSASGKADDEPAGDEAGASDKSLKDRAAEDGRATSEITNKELSDELVSHGASEEAATATVRNAGGDPDNPDAAAGEGVYDEVSAKAADSGILSGDEEGGEDIVQQIINEFNELSSRDATATFRLAREVLSKGGEGSSDLEKFGAAFLIANKDKF